MITEDYVSFETAKLLKEKGFDAKCSFVWAEQGNREPIRMAMPAFVEGEEWADRKTVDIAAKDYINPYNAENNSVTGYLCPTIQMAMKWLRKEYNIHIEPRYFPMPNIYRYVIIRSPATIENIDSHPQYFNSYEEACETAIKYCLENLI